MTRPEFESFLRKLIRPGPEADKAVTRILLAADEYAAHVVEVTRRPPREPEGSVR